MASSYEVLLTDGVKGEDRGMVWSSEPMIVPDWEVLVNVAVRGEQVCVCVCVCVCAVMCTI